MGAARVLILVVASLAVYANSLDGPLVLDDEVTIVANRQIRTLWSRDVLMPERELPVAGRPLVNVTLALNYAAGGTAPRGYRIVNLLLHVACGLLLYALARRVLALPSFPESIRAAAPDMAFAIALLWLLHPLTSEVVNYLTQRTEALMALFYLLTLYAGVRALDARRGRWQAVAIAACAAGVSCKESMVTAPVMMMVFDRVFIFTSWKQAWRERRVLYVGLLASWVLLGAILSTGPRIRSAGFSTAVSVWTYLLNQTEMIARYLYLTIWPGPLVAYYGFPRSLTLTEVLPYVILVIALCVVTAVLFRYAPKLAFAGAWFFITLSPTTSVVPIATEVGAERRMYLPLIALITLAVVAIWRASPRTQLRFAAVATIAILLGTSTFARNREYASSLHLAELDLERWPSGVAHHVLAQHLIEAGRASEAIPHLRSAIADNEPRAHYTLGIELIKQGDLDGAIAQLRTFIDKQPLVFEVPDAHVGLARAYARQKRWDEATAEARAAIEKGPDRVNARQAYAEVLFSQAKVPEATAAYADYLKFRPNDTKGLGQLGVLLAAQGRYVDAANIFGRAAQIEPSNFQWQFNLATALLDANLVDDAIAAAHRAIELGPGNPAAQNLLEQALARQRRAP